MYEIDPSRTDLVKEFRRNPDGPFSHELSLLINRMRLMPIADRHVLICLERGKRWMLARLAEERGKPVECFEDRVFTDHEEAVWEVFKLRWQTLTGQELQ